MAGGQRRRATIAVLLLMLLMGCGAILGVDTDDSPAPAPPPPADAAPPPIPVAPDAACGNNALDLEGCPCNAGERPNPCFHGSPSLNSVCSNGGTQQCVLPLTAGDYARWGKCEGGEYPRDAEVCFNKIDENCNGVLDEGCGVCSADVDLCRPGQDASAPPFTNRHTCFTIPQHPKKNQDFEIYIVSNNALLGLNQGAIDGVCNIVLTDPGDCFSTGRGCQNYNVKHIGKRNFPNAKSYTIEMYPPLNPPCPGNPPFTCSISVEN